MTENVTDASGIAVGDVVAERTVHLTRESLVRYAGASGDFNPIHYRDDVAASVGLPGVLAHGMLTMGLAVETVVPWLADAGRILDYGVRFTRPVVVDPDAGADVTVRATITAIDDEAVTVELAVTAADTAVLGKARLRARRD
ncbi:MaoC/PaaZ C-terminal domain-containing protein [Microbacterium sp. bgisy207]|jgi:acyl dehydratase|uniref:MaoC/PaaZ C-terminal domain-containing protein n=1 Tax=Microbacterium sp. bgisy207 TaxID=3413800 RepID=UPI003EBCA48A